MKFFLYLCSIKCISKMKLITNHLYTLAVTMAMVMLLLHVSSCHHGRRYSEYQTEQDSLRANVADSIIRAASRAGDLDRSSALIDSFEQCGDISPLRAEVRRAMVWDLRNDRNQCNVSLKKICDRCSQTGEEPRVYTVAAISLSNYLYTNDQFEEALRVALPAIAILKSSTYVPSDRKCDLLSIIGNCQMKLKLTDDAEKNFESAYEYCKRYLMKEDNDVFNIQEAVYEQIKIARNFSGIGRPEVYRKWIDRCDSLITWYETLPDYYPGVEDFNRGRICMERVKLHLEQGNQTEAAKAFAQFQKTGYAESDNGRYNSCTYLEAVGRYAEAADINKELDLLLEEWGEEMNLDAINNYLFPRCVITTLPDDATRHWQWP